MPALVCNADADQFKLSSPDTEPDGAIADEQVYPGFGCTGKNISPALDWSGAPKGAKSFALPVRDPDAPMGFLIKANSIGQAMLTGRYGRNQ